MIYSFHLRVPGIKEVKYVEVSVRPGYEAGRHFLDVIVEACEELAVIPRAANRVQLTLVPRRKQP